MNLETNELVSAGGKIGRIHAIVGKTIFVRFGANVYPFVRRQVVSCKAASEGAKRVIPNPIIHPVRDV